MNSADVRPGAPQAMYGSRQPPPSLQGGRYVLEDVLGEGGMAVVCRASDTELGVDRAIKVVFHTEGHSGLESLRRRLRQEARAMAQLRHPNILGIHDVGQQDDYDWVVMDLAEGSLRDLQAQGPLPPLQAIRILIQVLSALAVAHAAGIVHRDVKPHNILLDASGRPLLADFGIALLMGDDRRTRTGVAMGSLAYMPPEQRIDAARVGPGADIYAAGTTLYDLVTGDNPVDLFLAGEGDPRWNAVPEALRPILRRACRARPEDRYPDAGAMARDLMALLERTEPGELATLTGPTMAYPQPSNAFTDRSVAATSDKDVRLAMTFLDDNVVVGPSGPTLSPSLRTPTVVAPDDPTEPEPVLVAAPWPRGRVAALVAVVAVLAVIGLVAGSGSLRPSEVIAVAPEPIPMPDAEPEPEPEPKPKPKPKPEPEPEPEREPESPALVPSVAPSPPTPAPIREPAAPSPRPVVGGTSDPAPPFGRWTGSAGGIRMALELSGTPAAVMGSYSSRTPDGASVVQVPVRGTAVTTQGITRLVLVEQTDEEGTYDLVMEEIDGVLRLKGAFQGDAQRSVSLKWAP